MITSAPRIRELLLLSYRLFFLPLLLQLQLLLPFLLSSLLCLSPLPLLVRYVVRREINSRPERFRLRKRDSRTRGGTRDGGGAGGREGLRLLLLLGED